MKKLKIQPRLPKAQILEYPVSWQGEFLNNPENMLRQAMKEAPYMKTFVGAYSDDTGRPHVGYSWSTPGERVYLATHLLEYIKGLEHYE